MDFLCVQFQFTTKRKNNYINSLFFMELVKTDWFRRQFYSSNNGTTISYLSITDTRHLKVFLPSINLQKQFAQEAVSYTHLILILYYYKSNEI